jgi:putative ABC transport system permease protein
VVAGSFSPEVAERMAAVDGVVRVVRQRYTYGLIDGAPAGITGTDPDGLGFLELVAADGDLADLRDDTVLLQASYAEDAGLEVGDDLVAQLPTGEQRWEVVGTYEDNPVVIFPVLTTVDTLLANGVPDQDNALIVDVDDTVPGVGDRLEEQVADLPVVTVKDQRAFAAEQREPIDQFVLLIFALLALALVIAVLGIVNTLALSVIERTREVGLLRAIGLSRRQLRRMVTLESVVISVLGAVLGVLLGTFFGVVLMRALRDEGLEVISVPLGQLGLFLALSVVVGVLAAVLPARRAARLDVLRAIATE